MNAAARVQLRRLNSFGVAAEAAGLVTIDQDSALPALEFNPQHDLILGGGSNVLLAADLPGRVLLMRMRGLQLLERSNGQALVEMAAGEAWHAAVRWTLQQGFSGLENLSLIPGLAGAAPMQNIGAYGVELSERLESLRAWDWQQGCWQEFSAADCRFGYRDSLFKTGAPLRYLITAIRLRLDLEYQPRLEYAGVRDELDAMALPDPTALQVSDAIVRIRRRKLPDPEKLGNAGSFFKNPTLDGTRAGQLQARFPQMPAYPQAGGGVKLSAAWLIEQCGWKGARRGDAGVSAQHALVLVNHGRASGQDVLELAGDVAESVRKRFGVVLENEPRIIS